MKIIPNCQFAHNVGESCFLWKQQLNIIWGILKPVKWQHTFMFRDLSVFSKICKQIKPRKWLKLAWNSHPSELIQALLTASLLEVMEHLDDYMECLNNRMEVPQCGSSSHSQNETYLTCFRYIHMGYLSTKGGKNKVLDSPDPFLYIHFTLKWVTPLVSTD